MLSSKKAVWLLGTVAGVCAAVAVGAFATAHPPLETVRSLDLKRYAGKWYEIASFPARFQKNCTCTTAEYGLNPDGTVSVRNRCFDTKKNRMRGISGRAFRKDPSEPGRLKVQFFFPFKGDYQVIQLSDDYSAALVGTPDRKYLWVLSRTTTLPETTFQQFLTTARNQGFDLAKLRLTQQKTCP